MREVFHKKIIIRNFSGEEIEETIELMYLFKHPYIYNKFVRTLVCWLILSSVRPFICNNA
jgi:hypothetical protein